MASPLGLKVIGFYCRTKPQSGTVSSVERIFALFARLLTTIHLQCRVEAHTSPAVALLQLPGLVGQRAKASETG